MKYDYEKLSDEELFNLLSKGSEVSNRAFNEIYKRYSNRIYTFIYRLLGDKFFFRDIYQEVFSRIFSYGVEGKNKSMVNFRSYIYQTTKNICLNHFKSEERNKQLYGDYMNLYPGEMVDLTDTIELVRTAVMKLPENLREVFILYEYEEMNYPTIAEILGDTEGNVRVKLHRARKLIKEMVISQRQESNNLV